MTIHGTELDGEIGTVQYPERTPKPEAEDTGRPSADGAVTGRDGGSEARAFVSVYDGLDEPADGGNTSASILAVQRGNLGGGVWSHSDGRKECWRHQEVLLLPREQGRTESWSRTSTRHE
jgi:hypothetical protein